MPDAIYHFTIEMYVLKILSTSKYKVCGINICRVREQSRNVLRTIFFPVTYHYYSNTQSIFSVMYLKVKPHFFVAV